MALSRVFALAGVASAAAEIIPTVTLNNGVVMPVIAAGTWQYNESVAEQAVLDAFAAGFNHIDCAFDYQNQAGVARALQKQNREDYFLTTKVPGCTGSGSCASAAAKQVDADLRQLGVAQLDLVLIHFPPKGGCSKELCPEIQGQWAALEAAYAAGKARAIGVSNFCISCFECLFEVANTTVPALNQIEYHVGMGQDPEGLISYCQKEGIVVEAYSPLGDNTKELINGPLVTQIGKAHGKSGAQVALKWIQQQKGWTLTTKSTSPKHLVEDLDLFTWQLSPSEMDQLTKATTPKGTPSFMCTH
jgi:2,5-diketo-D-gluconate reductase A